MAALAETTIGARRPAEKARGTVLPRPDEVPVFPDLVFKEFLAALAVSVGLLLWALLADAPLGAEADPGRTENPAKAPWYFVGLQELLVYFDPWIAGVAIPTLIILGLMAIPYLDASRRDTGRYSFRSRRVAIVHFLFGFALWWALIAIGQFFRGPNWQFYWPGQEWSVSKSAEPELWNLPVWVGGPAIVAYFAIGLELPRRRWPGLYRALGAPRYAATMVLVLLMYAVPLKMCLRLLFGVKYVLVTPWFRI